MYLGLDLGTSALKAVLVDDRERIVASGASALQVQTPRPLWSEQDPDAWWQACQDAVDGLRVSHPAELAAVRGVGLAGQMHGATLLDAADRALRPAILWNDSRSFAQCAELEAAVPELTRITGNRAMAGFTAPKLLWLARHEPECFAQLKRVLLPKDYLRLRLTGEHVSEMSDAAGTLWLDVGARRWSEPLLAACGLSLSAMPRLVEGSEPSGELRGELCARWGMAPGVVVAGGAGDNAAGAVGLGVLTDGEGFVSLGTSGVYFAADAAYRPNPEGGVHTFCHALPERWHRMAVILSAASCLSWLSRLVGAPVAELLDELEAAPRAPGTLCFLPYLSGERTPHADAHAAGAFVGLTASTDRGALTQAVLQGVAFALCDGQGALGATGSLPEEPSLIGGGARSLLWARILASVLDRPLAVRAGAERGAAFGAARLARLSVHGESPAALCTAPPIETRVEPVAAWRGAYADRYAHFRSLYPALKGRFVPSTVQGHEHDQEHST